MNAQLQILLVTAASIGFFHTLMGPDHYLPFIMIGKAKNWSLSKVMTLTVFCGIGHVFSSVVLGGIGIVLELEVERLNWYESVRGDVAAWALIAFGLIYGMWGVRYWYRHKAHSHCHFPNEGGGKQKTTPLILFVIFVLGPCEPLIPVLMYPAARESMFALAMVSGLFAVVTILTMTGMVLLSSYGFKFILLKRFENWSHALAGFVIFLSGLSIQVLGL
ncbi:hypothetical protein DMA11_11015 [Marinilabiliaceae bacterium JC017]|nr:hypothetical protein DMA11_11015 [Marinilabiliaceae bacterium JC017]